MAYQAFYRFFAKGLINILKQEHECKILFIIWHSSYFEIAVLTWNGKEYVSTLDVIT